MSAVILNAVTSVTTQPQVFPTNKAKRTYQVTLQGNGAVSATVNVEYSNDQIAWFSEAGAPLTLNGSDTVSEFLPAIDRASAWVRASVSAITGDSAQVSVTLSDADA